MVVPLAFVQCWDSESESDDDGGDDASYRYDEIVSGDDPMNENDTWTYLHRSGRGGEALGDGVPKRQLEKDSFKLEYNPTDAMLLEKARLEVKSSLRNARLQTGLGENEPITPAASLAAVLPRRYVESFHEYLKAPLQPGERHNWTFSDILCFFKCEGLMRLYNASASELKGFGVKEEELLQYGLVRRALTRADQPASKRKVTDKASQLPACTFDPILKDAIDACNKHWTGLFFVQGVSWADLDDDKIPNCSPLWKMYGMKQTPTKDKKLKPVFHLMALIGAGYICYVAPDLLGVKLSELLRAAIDHVTPTAQAAHRAQLAFFIDRGYLELAQAQGFDITNLIQIMDQMGVKFLGTMKDSVSFPFQIVDLNEQASDGRKRGKKKPIVQGYGTRTSFSAKSGVKTVTVMRHGAGKVRAARGATNLLECSGDTWWAHHTLELHLQLWLAHQKDVFEHGTPPPCRRFIDILFSYWNHCMGNVDIVRKVLRSRKAKRGPDSGPGSLIWFELFGYALYDGLRLYQHGQLEKKIDAFPTFKQFQKARHANTYTSYLFQISGPGSDCFVEASIVEFFPGLREYINAGSSGDVSSPRPALASAPADESDANALAKEFRYKKMEPFLTPGDPMYNLRLDQSSPHDAVNLPKGAPRGRCILCCEFCAKGKCQAGEKGNKGRQGRKSKKYCATCGVVICLHCHEIFHSQRPALPPCSPLHHLIPPATREMAAVTPSPKSGKIKVSRSRAKSAPPTARSSPAPGEGDDAQADKPAARGANAANVTSPRRRPRRKKAKQAGSPKRTSPRRSGRLAKG